MYVIRFTVIVKVKLGPFFLIACYGIFTLRKIKVCVYLGSWRRVDWLKESWRDLSTTWRGRKNLSIPLE